jgi:hypothetical protein
MSDAVRTSLIIKLQSSLTTMIIVSGFLSKAQNTPCEVSRQLCRNSRILFLKGNGKATVFVHKEQLPIKYLSGHEASSSISKL